MTWSDWQPIDDGPAHDSAAVYELRLVSTNGCPISIPRFLQVDNRGILSIGETGTMESRRTQFLYALEKCSGHSEGNLLYYLLRYSPLNERFPQHQIEFRYHVEKDKDTAKQAEARMIKAYIREFGEVPPLNSAIPDRYGCWEPETMA